MRKVIYKYEIPVVPEKGLCTEISAPETMHVVHVAPNGVKSLWMWALIDLDAKTTVHRFRVVGTGHPVDSNDYPVGTAVTGPFVWHLMRMAP